MKYESHPVHRSGLPVACRHSGACHHSDGGAHGPGAGHYRDGLVRSAGSTRICTRRSRVHHGEVSQPIHAAYLRLRDGELLRQFHSRTWLFSQGLHRRRHDQSCESNWIRWFHHHAERDQCCIFQDRAGTPEYDDVPLLCDGVLCGAIPPGLVGRNRFRNRGLWRNCGNDHRIARADLYSIPCLRQTRLVVLGMAQGLSRIQLLQSCGRSHSECFVSCADQLLPPAWSELVGPFIDSPDFATSCSSGTGQHLHPFQDSDNDAHLIHWRHWRTRWVPRRSADGDAEREVNRQQVNEAKMSTETMSVETKATPQITRAAERYLEQYGDPLVMNTYLKVTILVLAVVCLVLAGLTFKSQSALASMHPMIVRINDVGRAEAIDYRNFQYRPQEAENKYYLSRWAELFFSRNRFTIERDQTSALYFLNSDVQRAVIDQERKDNIIPTYIKDSSLPYVDVEVKEVVLDDLRQSPYSARIEFVKVFTNPADHSELKRERWTATVTYVFRENVKNNELAVNPLGLTIVRFRADQAFS